jgi:amidophosphoribosyltransferase
VAHNRSIEEIAKEIGADRLIYQDLDDLIDAVRQENPELRNFDCSCFNGKYVTGGIDSQYLDELETRRNDKAMARAEVENTDVTAFEV